MAHRTFIPALGWPMIALVVAANALRWWCIATLGPYWSARVIVIPGTTLVRSGPYRWFAHPNYVAVIVEGAALPLAGSAWITACAFTVLNAALLTVRLRCETRALVAASGRPATPAAAVTPPLLRSPGRARRGNRKPLAVMARGFPMQRRCDRSPPRREAHRGSSRTVFREGDIRCGPGDPRRTGTVSLTRLRVSLFLNNRPIRTGHPVTPSSSAETGRTDRPGRSPVTVADSPAANRFGRGVG